MDTQEGKILSFSVTNYSSFKHKTTIDFEFKKNSQNTKNKIRYIKESGKKLLPVIGIYGKNASGKSNILKALFLHYLFINDANPGAGFYEFNPFEITDKLNENIESELTFLHKSTTYTHYIKYCKSHILQERLTFTDKSGIEKCKFNIDRENGNVSAREVFKGIEITEKHETFVNEYLNQNTIILLRTYLMYFEGSSGLSILPQILTTDVGYENKPYWNHYIANFKENIKDINLVLSNVQNHFNNIEIVLPHDNALYSLDAKYNVINDSEIKTYKLPFAKESMGTRKILLFASIFVLSLKNGSMLFVDEIDSVLHPDALRFFISAFKDPCINKKGAMLIFAAHNTKIIDFIDGENIVICNRNNTDFSSSIEVPYLYDDYDTKSLKKDIEDGRYGSVPIITKSLFIDELWKNEN